MRSRSVCGLIAVAMLTMPLTLPAATRDVVAEMAMLIENNYFDGDKGRRIARDLVRAERAGAFNSYSDPRDLAVALTLRLKAADRHFNVTWFAAPKANVTSAANDATSGSGFSGRNYGFRAVEMLPGAIGYIDVRTLPYISFRRTDDPARLAADSALQLVSGAAAILLDLRNAVGGYPEMAGYLVSAFVRPDAEVYNVFRGRGEDHSERPAVTYRSPKIDVPVYVLVSGSTASAAESTAYTLQAAKRAIVIGERTSGAANPGGTLPVRDGFNVFISRSTPTNPITGTNWEGTGVLPDIEVAADEALERAQVLALQELAKRRAGAVPTDVQWALEYLTHASSPRTQGALREYAGQYANATVSVVENALHIRRHRQVLRLRHLRDDTFAVEGDANLRVVFERASSESLQGFQLLRSNGFSIWHPRDFK